MRDKNFLKGFRTQNDADTLWPGGKSFGASTPGFYKFLDRYDFGKGPGSYFAASAEPEQKMYNLYDNTDSGLLVDNFSRPIMADEIANDIFHPASIKRRLANLKFSKDLGPSLQNILYDASLKDPVWAAENIVSNTFSEGLLPADMQPPTFKYLDEDRKNSGNLLDRELEDYYEKNPDVDTNIIPKDISKKYNGDPRPKGFDNGPLFKKNLLDPKQFAWIPPSLRNEISDLRNQWYDFYAPTSPFDQQRQAEVSAKDNEMFRFLTGGMVDGVRPQWEEKKSPNEFPSKIYYQYMHPPHIKDDALDLLRDWSFGADDNIFNKMNSFINAAGSDPVTPNITPYSAEAWGPKLGNADLSNILEDRSNRNAILRRLETIKMPPDAIADAMRILHNFRLRG